ncbi:O-antigen ligase family protein [Desulfosarcina ovata]|uniref:O-antigen ligase family protein n=1 Tax=Desulfosarcina ovata TaxID=83564 RepID=UPI001391604C|nr:O-antigen ligase family protein [Desulfosarcina ovata]
MHRILYAILISATVVMLYGYYQYFISGVNDLDGRKRIASLLGQYNAYGEYLAIAICGTIILFSSKSKLKKRYFIYPIFISLLISLFLSLNRGSWIAIFLSLLLGAFLFRKHINVKWVVCGIIIISIAFSGLIISRFSELSESGKFHSKNTFFGRMEHWGNALPLIIARPLRGYGTGTSYLVMGEYGNKIMAMHNDYLLLFLESGVIALLFYLTFLLRNLLYFIRYRSNIPELNFAVFTCCTYLLIISVVQNILNNVTVFPMYLCIVASGIKLNMLYIENRDSRRIHLKS